MLAMEIIKLLTRQSLRSIKKFVINKKGLRLVTLSQKDSNLYKFVILKKCQRRELNPYPL